MAQKQKTAKHGARTYAYYTLIGAICFSPVIPLSLKQYTETSTAPLADLILVIVGIPFTFMIGALVQPILKNTDHFAKLQHVGFIAMATIVNILILFT